MEKQYHPHTPLPHTRTHTHTHTHTHPHTHLSLTLFQHFLHRQQNRKRRQVGMRQDPQIYVSAQNRMWRYSFTVSMRKETNSYGRTSFCYLENSAISPYLDYRVSIYEGDKGRRRRSISRRKRKRSSKKKEEDKEEEKEIIKWDVEFCGEEEQGDKVRRTKREIG